MGGQSPPFSCRLFERAHERRARRPPDSRRDAGATVRCPSYSSALAAVQTIISGTGRCRFDLSVIYANTVAPSGAGLLRGGTALRAPGADPHQFASEPGGAAGHEPGHGVSIRVPDRGGAAFRAADACLRAQFGVAAGAAGDGGVHDCLSGLSHHLARASWCFRWCLF